jgi:hypothetical protein
MFDWVIPPQTAVTLYIYRVGRSCLTRISFTTRNSLGLLNSTRTRGPRVRLVRPTGYTVVAVAGSATGRPTGPRQPDRLCAYFGCEHKFC